MTYLEIESFLAICRQKTVSRAADSLFITQSSLSTRLKTLEKELGGALFFRKQGSREMTLTAAGKEFFQLALKHEALEKEMKQVCKKQPKSFRISCFNSLGTYLLPDVFERFMQEYPQIHLELQDMELESAEKSILCGLTDLTLTSGKASNDDLLQTSAFREPMVLICGHALGLTSPVSASDLPSNREVCVEWTNAFQHWHKTVFPDANPQITISIMAHLRQFLERGQAWAIVPVSVASGLLKDCNLQLLETDFPLPDREVSIITAANSSNPAIQAFCSCLQQVLQKHPTIVSLLP